MLVSAYLLCAPYGAAFELDVIPIDLLLSIDEGMLAFRGRGIVTDGLE